MGWMAFGFRSMIASRRKPSPTRPSSDTHVPTPSGPRWAIVSRIRSMRSGVIRNPASNVMAPVMPHMSGGAVEDRIDLERDAHGLDLLPQGDRPRPAIADRPGEGGELFFLAL